MSNILSANRKALKLGLGEVHVVVFSQTEVNITVKEEMGHFLLIDAVDSNEMFLLASLIQYAMRTHDIVFLARQETDCADLFILNGVITPLSKKELRQLKRALPYIKPESIKIPLLDSHDESIWDQWEHWKYKEQLRIAASKDLAIVNASQLGYKLLFHSCCYLATSYLGHSHFDWNSTKSSPELIIRNLARN